MRTIKPESRDRTHLRHRKPALATAEGLCSRLATPQKRETDQPATDQPHADRLWQCRYIAVKRVGGSERAAGEDRVLNVKRSNAVELRRKRTCPGVVNARGVIAPFDV